MKIISYIILLLLTLSIVYAVQPTQQYYKSYISPFYRDSMVSNTNYSYVLNVNPPDGISSVTSAIINFNGQINGQTQIFTLWVNGQSCNNPTYSVATAFSTTGNVQFAFDCSNRIIKPGAYNITLRSGVNTGAMQGWLDLTYMNNPLGSTDIFGTEYVEGDDGTIFLLLKDSSGIPIYNATCTIDIYYPNLANASHPEWINDGLMQYKEEGLYYYDFTAPLLEGLYMVNAQCRYITSNNYFYTLTKGIGPIRNVTTGTYTGDSFVLNDYQEWLYTQCDSGSASGGVKACDSYSEWNITSPTLSNVSALFMQYLGENNGANLMTFYWWNWSNNSWVILPNTLLFHATAASVPSGIDEYVSNSIPLSAISSGGIVRLRKYTVSGSTFKQFDNWLQLRTSEYALTIQDLKGSGEVHVSSAPPGINRFFKILSCNGFIDGRCGGFEDDLEFNLAEGVIVDYLNISATSTKSGVSISYTTPFSVDCSALYHVQEWNGSDWLDFNDYTLYSQPAYENCIITLLHDLSSGTEYDFKFVYDNYMKWEVGYSKVVADAVNMSLKGLCSGRNFSYINPIDLNSSLPSDLVTRMCYQAYDDEYWFNTFYDDSLSVAVAGEFASYVQESRFYRKELYDRYMWLILGNNTNLMSDYYADKVWKNPVRNLTYYPGINVINYTINNSVINYSINLSVQNVSIIVINYTVNNTVFNYTVNNTVLNYTVNNTFYNYIINNTVLNYTVNNTVYNFTVIVNNYSVFVYNYSINNTVQNYTVIVDNVSVNVQNITSYLYNYSINNTVQNYTIIVDNYTVIVTNVSVITQNVTVNNVSFSVNNVSINESLISDFVWNNSNRSLTYYPVQVDLTNYTKIVEDVWNYIGRYVHGILIS